MERKASAAGKKAADILKAHGRNQRKPHAARLARDVSKAQSKFTKIFTKAEATGACRTSGDAAAIEAKVDAFIGDVIGHVSYPTTTTSLPPTTTTSVSTTTTTSSLPPTTTTSVSTTTTTSGSGTTTTTVCDCCAAGPELLSFETGIAAGTCGQMDNFRCSGGHPNFQNFACIDSGDCDFGTCIDPPGICSGDFSVTCSGAGTPCQGTCQQLGGPIDLACGGRYSGGGSNSIPLPIEIPDRATFVAMVESCDGSTGELTLGATTPADAGELRCTQGRTCSTSGGPCVLSSDCPQSPAETCLDNCMFGPPLPIPNTNTTPTSLCIVQVVAEDASGSMRCDGRVTSFSLPLRSVVFRTGDILSSTDGPVDVPGIQPCPLCSQQCVGGADAGQPCEADSDCSGACDADTNCIGGIDNGDPCTPGSSALSESLPTSHECRIRPSSSITWMIGGVPLALDLTTGSETRYGVDHRYSRRTFCGFCRDVDTEGSGCFDGYPDPGQYKNCPDSVAQPTCLPQSGSTAGCGVAIPCTDDSDCTAPYESCAQRGPGAFSNSAMTRITVAGSTDGQCLADGQPHAAELVDVFCIPPTFDGWIDSATDLPGPGVALLQGEVQLQ
jgi:hypothetical protein